jgi:hypothetical protein
MTERSGDPIDDLNRYAEHVRRIVIDGVPLRESFVWATSVHDGKPHHEWAFPSSTHALHFAESARQLPEHLYVVVTPAHHPDVRIE